MRAPRTCLWSALLWLLTLQPISAQYGSSYLGCFSFSRMLYLKGVEGVKATQHTQETIGSCFADCRRQGHSLSIVATDWRCWCAIATPPPGAQMDESACAQGSNKGALVFSHYEGDQACRVQELNTDASNFITSADAKSNQGVTFDSLAQHLLLNPNSGPQRVVAKFPAQSYGQFEVSARVSVHPAVVTSIDIQEAGTSGPQATKAASSEDISLQFYNTTASGVGKNLLLGTASRAKSAASALDFLLKPAQYKSLAALRQEENLGTAYLTYTIDWQSDRVTWAMNGVPLLTKWRSDTDRAESGKSAAGGKRKLLSILDPRQQDQQRRQQQRKQSKAAAQQQAQKVQQQQPQQQLWEPPSAPAQLSFGVRLNPKAESNTQQQQQQQQQPLMSSAFMEARRIVCDKPRVRGDKGPVVPTWFVLGSGWQVQQQGAARQQQQQQKQPQKQQAKVQAGKKANPDAASVPGKPAGGSKGGQGKQQPEAYSWERRQQQQQQQQQKHASKPAAVQGRRRRDRFAEEMREQQPQQQQQGQLAWQAEEDRWPGSEEEQEAAWYARLLGKPDDEEEPVWALVEERREPDAWRWSATAEMLSWAEDEPDWPELNEAV